MRLDHLLSKEHTPRPLANVRWRMVVFTSGIVDAVTVAGVMLVVVVVRSAQRWLGGRSSTLLGPEGSAARSALSVGWVECVGLLVLPLSAGSSGSVGVGGVVV